MVGEKHGNKQLQDSQKPSGSPGKPYKSGANVGNKSGPSPSDPAPNSQPSKQTY